MSRRKQGSVLALLVLLSVVLAFAINIGLAEPAPKVVLVTFTPATRNAFVAGLEELGYQEGRNVTVEWRRPSADAPLNLGDLVRLNPACLVLGGPINLAAGRKLGKTIPIIAIDLESDPVSSGFAASLAHPGENVTGIFLDLPELAGKQIQRLREVVPTLARLAVLFDARVGDAQLQAAHLAAKAAGVSLDPIRSALRLTWTMPWRVL